MTTETLPATAPAEPTTPIKPSEALRLGRLLFPVRITGDLFDGALGACSVGAMAAGFGLNRPANDDEVQAVYSAVGGHLNESASTCPACGRRPFENDPVETVWHLNDNGHLWSDDQIVAWLESLGL